VRLGEASNREALGPLLDRLRGAGLEGLWITEEPATSPRNVRLRLVDASYESRAVEGARIAVVPASGAFVQVEGKPYRGLVELRITAAGTVRAIDWVEMEAYLLGVVPAELGPEIWPQVEALKAQAVAARTYVWRNLGQFAEDGFDLCATPRCQAPGSAEHPLSIARSRDARADPHVGGKPISALYTATCGGHAEDAEQIFPRTRAPHLRGVPCARRAMRSCPGSVLAGRESGRSRRRPGRT
jgi:stage II sporulation protein D